jgi:hypothetical protein
MNTPAQHPLGFLRSAFRILHSRKGFSFLDLLVLLFVLSLVLLAAVKQKESRISPGLQLSPSTGSR